jgi:hypothetical protein
MGPDVVVEVVDGGQQTPEAVDLRVVLVDFRHNQEDGGDCQGEEDCRHEGVGREVNVLECCTI